MNYRRTNSYMQGLHKWLQDECIDKKKVTLDTGWSSNIITNIPFQTNSYDCGMFVATYAYHLSNDLDLNKDSFQQADMPHYRTKFLCSIIRCGIEEQTSSSSSLSLLLLNDGNVSVDNDDNISPEERKKNAFTLSCFFCTYCERILRSFEYDDNQALFELCDTVRTN